MGKSAKLLCFITFFIVLALHGPPTTSQEVEDETEFNYEEGGERGPARWGELHPEWRLCSNGTMQSPIDLVNRRAVVASHLGRLNRSYVASNATLRNRGHDIMLSWEGGAGSININGTVYVLQQCHWHSPSEHTINGRRFALEVHMVHQSLDGKIAVVGIVYTIGRADPFLSSLRDPLRSVAGNRENATVVGFVDPTPIQTGTTNYYRYFGSLTVPPCTENVLWTVFSEVKTATREQVRMLRVAVHDDSNTNARPLQPINGRTVQLFKPMRK